MLILMAGLPGTGKSTLSQPWRILECICSDESARRRLESNPAHPAINRDYGLYLAVKARFEEITLPKAVIDTDQPLERCVDLAKKALLR
jgi:dephospho-CoA kinase